MDSQEYPSWDSWDGGTSPGAGFRDWWSGQPGYYYEWHFGWSYQPGIYDPWHYDYDLSWYYDFAYDLLFGVAGWNYAWDYGWYYSDPSWYFDMPQGQGDYGWGDPPPCLAAGTLIRTPFGNRPVEELQIGDLVLTPDGPQPLKFLGISTRHVNTLKATGRMPIRIQAGVFGDNLPSADIYCTPSHAFALGDCLVEAQALINGQSIYQLEELSEYDQRHQYKQGSPLAEHKEVAMAMVMADSFTYYSLEFEQHVLVWANDLLTESYLPTYRDGELTRLAWNNYDNYLSLYESSETMDELPMPRIPFSRQLPQRIREQFGLVNSYGPSSAGANREELCLTL
jgi:hypothetical protein